MITNSIARKKGHPKFFRPAFMIIAGGMLFVDGLLTNGLAQSAVISDTTTYDTLLVIEENRSHRKRFHPLEKTNIKYRYNFLSESTTLIFEYDTSKGSPVSHGEAFDSTRKIILQKWSIDFLPFDSLKIRIIDQCKLIEGTFSGKKLQEPTSFEFKVAPSIWFTPDTKAPSISHDDNPEESPKYKLTRFPPDTSEVLFKDTSYTLIDSSQILLEELKWPISAQDVSGIKSFIFHYRLQKGARSFEQVDLFSTKVDTQYIASFRIARKTEPYYIDYYFEAVDSACNFARLPKEKGKYFILKVDQQKPPPPEDDWFEKNWKTIVTKTGISACILGGVYILMQVLEPQKLVGDLPVPPDDPDRLIQRD